MKYVTLQVVEEAKKLIEANPNKPYVVHEFKAFVSGKVSSLVTLHVHYELTWSQYTVKLENLTNFSISADEANP